MTSTRTSASTRLTREVDANSLSLFEITYFLEVWRTVNSTLSKFSAARVKQLSSTEAVMAGNSPEATNLGDTFRLLDEGILDTVYLVIAKRFAAGKTTLFSNEDAYIMANEAADGDLSLRRFLEDRLLLEASELNSQLAALGATQADGLRRIIAGLMTVSTRHNLLPTELPNSIDIACEAIALTDTLESRHRRYVSSPLRTVDGVLRFIAIPVLRAQGRTSETISKALDGMRADEAFMSNLQTNLGLEMQVFNELTQRIWPGSTAV